MDLTEGRPSVKGGKMHHRKILTTLCCMAAIAIALVLSPTASADQTGSFHGAWTASGKWQSLDFEPGREVFTFKLAGHVNLKDNLGEVRDLWGECIGLWDSRTGGSARCTWRDPEGDSAAYMVLDGRITEKGSRLTGHFISGAGALTGLTGDLSFSWSTVFRDRTNQVFTGYSKDLEGTYRIAQ